MSYSNHFHSASLQTGSGACGHSTAPFAKSGVCARAFTEGITRSERQEGANVDGNGVGVKRGRRWGQSGNGNRGRCKRSKARRERGRERGENGKGGRGRDRRREREGE